MHKLLSEAIMLSASAMMVYLLFECIKTMWANGSKGYAVLFALVIIGLIVPTILRIVK